MLITTIGTAPLKVAKQQNGTFWRKNITLLVKI